MRPLLLSLTLALPLGLARTWIPSQDPAPQDDPPSGTDEGPVTRDLFGRPVKDEGEMYEKLQGAWQLVAIDDPELPEAGRSLHGMMIIAEQFLAIELHVAWDDPDGEPIEDAFQTGFHEFSLDRTGNMKMLSLIGSFLDEEEELDWEAPGNVRDFRVHTDGAFLTLSRLDGSNLKFVRRRPRVGQSRDIFGRSVPGMSTDLVDIYGRPLPAPEIEQREGDDETEEDGDG